MRLKFNLSFVQPSPDHNESFQFFWREQEEKKNLSLYSRLDNIIFPWSIKKYLTRTRRTDSSFGSWFKDRSYKKYLLVNHETCCSWTHFVNTVIQASVAQDNKPSTKYSISSIWKYTIVKIRQKHFFLYIHV